MIAKVSYILVIVHAFNLGNMSSYRLCILSITSCYGRSKGYMASERAVPG